MECMFKSHILDPPTSQVSHTSSVLLNLIVAYLAMMGNTMTITESNKQEELVNQSDRLQNSQQLRQLSRHLIWR